jgi:hypothetical protein
MSNVRVACAVFAYHKEREGHKERKKKSRKFGAASQRNGISPRNLLEQVVIEQRSLSVADLRAEIRQYVCPPARSSFPTSREFPLPSLCYS